MGRKKRVSGEWIDPFEFLKTAKPFVGAYQGGLIFKRKSRNIAVRYRIARQGA
jgi:hypothetical protein